MRGRRDEYIGIDPGLEGFEFNIYKIPPNF